MILYRIFTHADAAGVMIMSVVEASSRRGSVLRFMGHQGHGSICSLAEFIFSVEQPLTTFYRSPFIRGRLR